MAKLTKAQARKRITEAKAKVAQVFGANLQGMPRTFLDDCFKCMKALENLRNKI